MAGNPAPNTQDIVAMNAGIRQQLLAVTQPMLQPIYNQNIDPTQQVGPVNISPAYTGLIRGFFVQVTATIRNGGGGAVLNLTPFGAANILSNITFNDLSNTQRISTTGAHIAMLNSAKQPMVMGGAYSPNIGIGFGSNATVISAPATVANATDATVQMIYYIPLAYTANDLRGAMWAGAVNASANLGLTINPSPVQVTGSDQTNSIYIGPGGGTTSGYKAATKVNIQVWQDYLDQVPMINGQPYLPPIDQMVFYELKNTFFAQGLSVGADFPIPFPNFRRFLSLGLVFDNGGTLNPGTDINTFQIRTANSTPLLNITPTLNYLLNRNIFHADTPLGVHWFDFRNKPIVTDNYGNQNLIINPSVVNANAQFQVYWEDIADITQIRQATSLPGS